MAKAVRNKSIRHRAKRLAKKKKMLNRKKRG
jgi:hypothetical protein